MIKRLICLLCVMAIGIAQAKAEQGCPYASSVKYMDGHFQAESGSALWQSPNVGLSDFADRFVGALFTPGKGQERENGFLEKCVYRMGSGGVVALRYGVPGKLNTMSLTSTLYWQPTRDLLGQDVYICQDSQPDNCSFTVRRLN
ncbi:DUF3757 domain-containing protein [Pseudomonas sp. KBS0710]|uniref:DUF3757 domain-containing protein n=1 Tax=Pseudomonas sp. KBS0710 TaxID=1179667 RepID=UPI00110F55DB|nr:DUF3757 domain-containing protein [Pseudomonas sp. KBS0710]TSD78419.1 DUF3757 domain-containing protein [Pseudomonas sp. KBS0710]